MMKCFNMKVIAGLAVAGVAILFLAPNLFTAALPLLVLAACPLSMLLMMRMMGGAAGGSTTGDSADELARLRAEVSDLRRQQPLEPSSPEVRPGNGPAIGRGNSAAPLVAGPEVA